MAIFASMKNALRRLTGESSTCEYKRALERAKITHWLNTVSAFANSVGGSLFFGVDDRGQIVGLDKLKADTEFISSKIKEHLDPVPDFHLEPLEAGDGKQILELRVPAGALTPYYCVSSGSRTAYVRMGDQSVKTTATQLNALVLKGRNVTYDSLPTEYSLDSMTFDTLAKRYQEQTGLPFEQKLLSSFSLVTPDGLLTQAGLLFADQCPYRHSSIYCTRWEGLKKDDVRDTREYQGNLLKLLDAGVQFIELHNMKGWIKLPNRRLNTPDYSSRALFEALVNALIHRDYSVLGSEVHIDIFDDRLVIFSPGGMLDGTRIQECSLDDVASKRRNPILADVFAQLAFMEKRGSGLRKIQNESAKLPGYVTSKKPQFRSEHIGFYVELLNNRFQFQDQDGADDTVSGTVNHTVDDTVSLTPLQRNLLEQVMLNSEITRQQLSENLNVSVATIRRIVKQLKAKRLLDREGNERSGYWLLPYDAPEQDTVNDTAIETDPGRNPDTSL